MTVHLTSIPVYFRIVTSMVKTAMGRARTISLNIPPMETGFVRIHPMGIIFTFMARSSHG
jgi:hypothetical protein